MCSLVPCSTGWRGCVPLQSRVRVPSDSTSVWRPLYDNSKPTSGMFPKATWIKPKGPNKIKEESNGRENEVKVNPRRKLGFQAEEFPSTWPESESIRGPSTRRPPFSEHYLQRTDKIPPSSLKSKPIYTYKETANNKVYKREPFWQSGRVCVCVAYFKRDSLGARSAFRSPCWLALLKPPRTQENGSAQRRRGKSEWKRALLENGSRTS